MIQATNKAVKRQKINTKKTTRLNLRQKLLNRVFLNILMHLLKLQETTVTADNNAEVAFKNCAPFSACKTN